MTETPSPEQNHLLAAIPESAKPRVFQHLKLVELVLGDVIYESDQPIEFVYFPTNCIISLLYVMRSGASAEISVIGKDGLVGVSVVLGGQQHTQPSDRTEPGIRLSNVGRGTGRGIQYFS